MEKDPPQIPLQGHQKALSECAWWGLLGLGSVLTAALVSSPVVAMSSVSWYGGWHEGFFHMVSVCQSMCPSVIAVFQGVCFTRTHSFSCLAPWPLYACQVCTHTCTNTHTQMPDFSAWQSGMAIRLMQCHQMWVSFLHYLFVPVKIQ